MGSRNTSFHDGAMARVLLAPFKLGFALTLGLAGLLLVAWTVDWLFVAHGHVLRILTARWLGLPPVAGRLFALDPARVSALGFEHEQHVITQWNARPSR